MIIFEIIFSIIGTLIGPLLKLILVVGLPMLGIYVVIFVIQIKIEEAGFRKYSKENGLDRRYKNPSYPDGYRRSEDMIMKCATCCHSLRTYNEGISIKYCQKHQRDVSEECVCDNFDSGLGI